MYLAHAYDKKGRGRKPVTPSRRWRRIAPRDEPPATFCLASNVFEGAGRQTPIRSAHRHRGDAPFVMR